MTIVEIKNFLCNLILDELEKYDDNKSLMYRKTGIPANTIRSLIDGRSVGIHSVVNALDALGYEIEIKKK